MFMNQCKPSISTQKNFVIHVGVAILCVVSILTPVQAEHLNQLKAMSLEELSNLEVSIASKTPKSVNKIPAAVFVVTSDDIRRSSATSVPELLRMVPGLHVARIDGSHWAVTARGFSGRFANKLLVLMDGRAVYTPEFSGVYWNVQDTLLEDVERIEVIRGPGATVWGANAVNGVINIITRSAEDTHGNLASLAVGDPEVVNAGIRHGGAINENVDYRVFAKFRKNNKLADSNTSKANDDWEDSRLGFRMDGLLTVDDDFTLQGDVYRNRENQLSVLPDWQLGQVEKKQTLDDVGGNVLARWGHSLRNNDKTLLQIYYDYQRRDEADDKRHTIDVEFQYQFSPKGQHHFTTGLGYRWNKDEIKGQPDLFAFYPARDTQEVFSAFIQDEIQLNEQWTVTLGSKIEHNNYTGFEVQPSARLLWQPKENHSAWLSVSKASRTPSRSDNDVYGTSAIIPASLPLQPFPILVSGIGNPEQDAEELLAYEIGYRFQFAEQLSLDIAAFYNDYSNLRTFEINALDFSNLPAYIEQRAVFDNKGKGQTWGLEIAADWRFAEKWRLQTAYSFLEMDLDIDNDSNDTSIFSTETQSPKHQLSLRLSFDPASDWETDLWVRYVDEVYDSADISQYWAVDARIGWQVNHQFQLSVVGQNLFDSSHLEFDDELGLLKNTEVPRGFFIKAVWEY